MLSQLRCLSLIGALLVLVAQPVQAQENSDQIDRKVAKTKADTASKNISQLSEIKLPATSAQMLVQSPTPDNPPTQAGSVVTITGVKASLTENGVEVILETIAGDKLQVANRSTGNNFIADITGGQLRLANGDAFTFKSEKPLAGITSITVINIDANTVRVTVIGEKALPVVELFDDNAGLIFAVASTETATKPPDTTPVEEKPVTEKPQEKPDDPIELVVTGEQDGYNVPNASTATRTDTPIRDIPQSIQVVPRQVLEDRKTTNITQAVETVSGVLDGGNNNGQTGNRIIRGFEQGFVGSAATLRNGTRDVDYYSVSSIGTIEQVEVLKGPASVLFGALEPGGVINIVTRQPLTEPYYRLEFEAGNYGVYQPGIDVSGPLTGDKNLLYRFIASYRGADSFQDFVNSEQTTIAPSITWNLGDRTSLNLYYEYTRVTSNPPESFALLLADGSLTPRNLFIGYPDIALFEKTTQRYGYSLKHEFNDNWQIRNTFAGTGSTGKQTDVVPPFSDVIDQSAPFPFTLFLDGTNANDSYAAQIDVLGKFKTGSIEHQLLIGADYYRSVYQVGELLTGDLPPFDIRNPNYDASISNVSVLLTGFSNINSNYGIYLQDQIAFSDNLKLLIGGRYNWVSSENETFEDGIDQPIQYDGAFSPRIGLVYQPSDAVSLYASYATSFFPTSGFNPDGRAFEPTEGTQYEVGVKADFLDKKLSTTLAVYQITKTNVTTTDPNNPLFSIQTGEQRSRGIELDVAGELLPGWKVTASYAYTDAIVTKDEVTPVGNQLPGAPQNQASLWTTYEIQKGDLKGLGFGLGLFYVGNRQGDLDNSFELDDYLRTDGSLYYRRDGFRAGINIRNLFDIDYVRASTSRNYIYRGEPLTITGSISWEF
ncbi:MAG: TonB-dependent siderophore receptor [Desmonostoc vinosum HA7617-LM4]|jgi:iron complex outermembrane receptor protein|nr:TonB-dependent siderophore receptor [Desmonostoc vinosum HA7617-LM4]